MPLKQTISDDKNFRNETRRIIEKLHDLEYKRKLDRIYSKKASDEFAVVRCVQSLRAYVICCFDGIDDLRVDQLKNRLVGSIDVLIRELEFRASNHLILIRGLVANTLRSHGNLFNEVAGRKLGVTYCPDEWSSTVNLAVYIWGNQI